MKILFISAFFPYENVSHAGGKTVYYYLNSFAKDDEVTLLTFVTKQDFNKLDHTYPYRLVPAKYGYTVKDKVLRFIMSKATKYWPLQKYCGFYNTYDEFLLKKKLAELAREKYKPDIIILEWTQCVLTRELVHNYFPDSKIVASEHDLSVVGFQRKVEAAEKGFTAKKLEDLKRLELGALAQYEILTYLFDSYYVLPERPDLAALFCWQAINHSYYVQQLSDNNVGFCQDTKGIELIRDAILGDWNNKYKAILEPFLKRMPDKTFHYVASYMLKGYAMEKKGIAEKYRASSYKTLKRKIPSLLDILDNAYGKSYCKISNPTLVNNEVDLGITNANKGKSRAITHSFGTKLKALMLGEEVEITFCDVQGTKKTYKFTEVERMSFVLFGILYASRCNNFHGNVAARMNSINANKDTFKMYTDMFLTEYIILAIHLNSQGALSDVVLNKVKKNANLMI